MQQKRGLNDWSRACCNIVGLIGLVSGGRGLGYRLKPKTLIVLKPATLLGPPPLEVPCNSPFALEKQGPRTPLIRALLLKPSPGRGVRFYASFSRWGF